MSCHFGRGVLVGGLVGAFVAMNWRRVIKDCPVYQKIEDMVFDEDDEPRSKCRRHHRRHDYYSDRDL